MTAQTAISWEAATDHDQEAVVRLLMIQAERLEGFARDHAANPHLSRMYEGRAAAFRAAVDRLGGER